ncbi:hypothetical protein FRB99_003015 [Tulasnella sp. 403]|nr:hypothetical protein FRB99_003015 [Tulasnella sp. 403]
MQDSDQSDEERNKYRKAKTKGAYSRKDMLKKIRRRPLRKRSPGSTADIHNPIRVLLGLDFDIPAFHRRDKARHSLQKDAVLRNAAISTDDEVADGEDDDIEDEDDEELPSPVATALAPQPPHPENIDKLHHAPPTDPVQAAPRVRSSPPRNKRPASRDYSATESEAEQPFVTNPPSKRTRITSPQRNSSETESEAEIALPQYSARPHALVQEPHEETESESEVEITKLKPIDPATDPLHPRPAFKATPEQQLKPALVLDAADHVQVPRSVAMYLRPYQEDGVRFFWERYKEGRGGVLGDDMGLGKTIQVISFLSAIMRKGGNRKDKARRYNWVNEFLDTHNMNQLPEANSQWPTGLIVAPKTVVENWARELETWGYFEVCHYSGTPPQRSDVLKSFKMGRYDVLLASHETVRDNIAELESLSLSCIFVDEAHKIKNDKSQTAQAYNRFDCQVRFGLTGTAIQNSYRELWPLLNWSNPGRLGTQKQWNQTIVTPMQEGQSKDATQDERLGFAELARRFVERVLPHFFLRRTKELIKHQLPEKVDKVVFCPLTKTQVDVYERFLATEDVQLMLHKDEPCDCGKGAKRGNCCHVVNKDGVEWHKLLLKYIDIMIKISNSLLLIYPGPEDSVAQVARNRQLMKVAFPDGRAGTYATALTNRELCGKWEVLCRLLRLWKSEVEKKNKILIFSKSVKLLDFLSMWLGASGFVFRQLDGKVKQEDRFKLIDDFNLDPEVFIFLISTLTGGTGLNLVAANKAHPAHDLQAMDRAYRFGQQRDVSVYRLLGAGSLEELVYARQLYKQQQMRIGYNASLQTRLFAGVQGNASRQGELFGLKNILTLRKDLITKEQIEDAHVDNLEWALKNTEVAEAEDMGEASQMRELLLGEVHAKQVKPEDSVDGILSRTGVQYSHVNDHILRDNHIEAKRLAKAQEAKGKAKARPKPKKGAAPTAVWPPKRSHHKALDAASHRLQSRREAILAAGHDLATFAEEFSAMTPDEQDAKLQELDAIADASSS